MYCYEACTRWDRMAIQTVLVLSAQDSHIVQLPSIMFGYLHIYKPKIAAEHHNAGLWKLDFGPGRSNLGHPDSTDINGFCS